MPSYNQDSYAYYNPSNWRVLTNDGTNLTAYNEKTRHTFNGTTAAFNALISTIPAQSLERFRGGEWGVVETNAKVIVNGDILFTVAGGPILIWSMMSECVTANDATASTLQYQSAPTVGSPATISGASSSLASIAAGATVLLTPTALTTAPTIALAAAGGVQLGLVAQNKILVNAGTIKAVVGVGSTTGTWKHRLVYIPLGVDVSVT